MALIRRPRPVRHEPTAEQMQEELLAAGWATWEQMITVWITPDGGLMLGTKSAWQIMAKERAKRLDS